MQRANMTHFVANRCHIPHWQARHRGDRVRDLAVALPPDTGPLHKLINGQVFTWGPMSVDQDQPPVLAWDKDRSNARGLEITAWPNYVDAGRGPLAAVQRRNQTGDNRPATVSLPPPQQTELTLVYGDQRLVVPLTISYALNQAYDPTSVRRAANACNNGPFFTWVCLVSLGGIAVIVGVSAGLKRLQRG